MKIALYIEDGLEQIVLTPESDVEKGIVSKLRDGSRELSIYTGAFYPCVGGWTRWGSVYSDGQNANDNTIIVLRPKPSEPTS